MTRKERSYIANLLKNVCDKNYSQAEKSLDAVVSEKLKQRIRTSSKQQEN